MNTYSIEETKSLIIKALDSSSENTIGAIAGWVFSDNELTKSKMRSRIRDTKNPDLLEQVANLIILAGIYYEDEKFYFPEETYYE
jgi:hypothetical protein